MSHIAIDARVINSGTGTYVVKLLEYLQKIDHHNTYRGVCDVFHDAQRSPVPNEYSAGHQKTAGETGCGAGKHGG